MACSMFTWTESHKLSCSGAALDVPSPHRCMRPGQHACCSSISCALSSAFYHVPDGNRRANQGAASKLQDKNKTIHLTLFREKPPFMQLRRRGDTQTPPMASDRRARATGSFARRLGAKSGVILQKQFRIHLFHLNMVEKHKHVAFGSPTSHATLVAFSFLRFTWVLGKLYLFIFYFIIFLFFYFFFGGGNNS